MIRTTLQRIAGMIRLAELHDRPDLASQMIAEASSFGQGFAWEGAERIASPRDMWLVAMTAPMHGGKRGEEEEEEVGKLWESIRTIGASLPALAETESGPCPPWCIEKNGGCRPDCE